jgi:hypothetical protein
MTIAGGLELIIAGEDTPFTAIDSGYTPSASYCGTWKLI